MDKRYAFIVIVISFALLGAGCAAAPSELTSKDNANNLEDAREENIVDVAAGKKLDLSNSGLTQVSQDVFKQTNVVELDLSGNRLTGAIPAEIRLLSELEVLDLSDNALTGLPAEVGQLRNLKMLDLSNNQLTGLPFELSKLTNLKILDLRGNNYSKYDLDQIRGYLTQTKMLVD